MTDPTSGTRSRVDGVLGYHLNPLTCRVGKVDGNGRGSPALGKHLTSEKNGLKDAGPVKWNFEKFLIDRNGKVVGRFKSGVSPQDAVLTDAIKAAL